MAPDTAQGRLFELPAGKGRRRPRYRHVHTAEELVAFERSMAITAAIRPAFLAADERLCPGHCGKIIRGKARTCGRRWCDAVRPTWGRAMADVLQKGLDAYCELYGSEAKVLSFAMTCTARPGWWDTERCSHGPAVPCSGTIGCRVRPEIEKRERELWRNESGLR